MSKETKQVVVVTGASRGIGRGIARVFGRRGATVYVVGRSQVKGTQRSRGGAELSGTIHEVAAEVTAAGGNTTRFERFSTGSRAKADTSISWRTTRRFSMKEWGRGRSGKRRRNSPTSLMSS